MITISICRFELKLKAAILAVPSRAAIIYDAATEENEAFLFLFSRIGWWITINDRDNIVGLA